jgi:hypothetical protein
VVCAVRGGPRFAAQKKRKPPERAVFKVLQYAAT